MTSSQVANGEETVLIISVIPNLVYYNDARPYQGLAQQSSIPRIVLTVTADRSDAEMCWAAFFTIITAMLPGQILGGRGFGVVRVNHFVSSRMKMP